MKMNLFCFTTEFWFCLSQVISETMDILFRIRGGLDLAFQLATANGKSDQKNFFFIIN